MDRRREREGGKEVRKGKENWKFQTCYYFHFQNALSQAHVNILVPFLFVSFSAWTKKRGRLCYLLRMALHKQNLSVQNFTDNVWTYDNNFIWKLDVYVFLHISLFGVSSANVLGQSEMTIQVFLVFGNFNYNIFFWKQNFSSKKLHIRATWICILLFVFRFKCLIWK